LSTANVLRCNAADERNLLLILVLVRVEAAVGDKYTTRSKDLVAIDFDRRPSWREYLSRRVRSPSTAQGGADKGVGYRPIGVERGASIMHMVVQAVVGGGGSSSLSPCLEPLCKDGVVVGGVPTEHGVDDVPVPSATSIHDAITVVPGNGSL
jgi:hypothetical protein